MGTLVHMAARDPFDRLLDKCEWVGDCLIWTGVRARHYGMFRPTTRTADPKVYVHRWVYETTVGPIPEGLEIDHVKDRGCTSTLCINPDHLEPVTHVENQRRGRLETCRSGRHDLTNEANVQFDNQGRRRGCLVCHREKSLAHYKRRKEAAS